MTIAAIGTDGMRPVVWGIGATEAEAEADARLQDGAPSDLTCREITEADVAAIEAGDVAAEALGRPMTTEITDEVIEALRTESGAAGDLEMVAICDRALDGDADAWQRCVDVIDDARAQIRRPRD